MPLPRKKFLVSSTSQDLAPYRQRLDEALLRLEQDGIAMEYFGAETSRSVDVCRRKVEEADVIILVIAHRYGWIPSVNEGGDGATSITHLEFEHARSLDKPVPAFVVDPSVEWAGPKEQDALANASTGEEGLAVWRAVQALQAFQGGSREPGGSRHLQE